MNLLKKGYSHRHRGLIGVEATLVIIAVVLVAAALAFVTLNIGFSTSQKAKTTISSTLSSTSSIEVEGKVIASSYMPAGGAGSLNITSIPIKIVAGGESANLDPTKTAVKYLSDQITYDDIYRGTLQSTGTYNSLASATAAAVTATYITLDPFNGGDVGTDDWPRETGAFIYWTVTSNTNDILEVGEHANLVIAFAAGDRPVHLDKLRVELILAGGSTMTVERAVPPISNQVVDLG